MARHRRMLAPINSIKHYVGQPRAVIGVGASLSLEIADVVNAPVSSTREKITIGSMIKAIHVEMWILGGGATNTSSTFVMIVEKIPSGQADPTFADMLNLGGYNNKKNILYTTEGIIGSNVDGTGMIPIIRDWMLIPKGKQRMGQGDRLVLTLATVEQSLVICGIFTYKEYV